MKVTWFVRDVEGTNMKVVNLPFIYQLGAEIRELLNVDYKKRLDVLMACVPVRVSIEYLHNEYPILTTSHKPGEAVVSAIGKGMEWFNKMKVQEKPDWNMDDSDVRDIFHEIFIKTKNFEIVLKADLSENLKTYHPQPKAGYSMEQLIAHAENIFHLEVLKKLDRKSIQEVRESGRCLAFDNFTASGFHMLRAIEVVLHEYYVVICNPAEPNKPLDSWPEYLKPLYKLIEHDNNASNTKDKSHIKHVKRVYYLLQQIKDLDRNNIMHPETMLNEADAFKLFEIAKTAIIIMVEKLPIKNTQEQHGTEPK